MQKRHKLIFVCLGVWSQRKKWISIHLNTKPMISTLKNLEAIYQILKKKQQTLMIIIYSTNNHKKIKKQRESNIKLKS